ncbi:MAG: NAD-dependent epimerase/dehydratase family protein [Actinomycetota bacterium]
MSSCRLAMIGCGAVAERFHLPALAANPRTSAGLILVDTDEQRLAAAAERFGPADTATSHEELEGRVDGVIIATPPASHHPLARWFLARGIAVLSEKPLTEDLAAATELVTLADQAGTALAVNHTRRLFPTYQRIRRLCAEGALGEIRSIVYHDGIEFRWPVASAAAFAPGASGALSDKGVHLIDTICYWLDATPELLSSCNDGRGGPEAMATLHLRHGPTEIELKVSRLGELANRFRIEGTEGTIEAGVEDWNEITIRSRSGAEERIKCGLPRDTRYTDFASPLIDNFVDVVAGTAVPVASGADALAAVDLLERAYREAKPYAMPWSEPARPTGPTATPTPQADDPAPSRRVLVTGASGFLGGRLVECLWADGRYEPVGTIRTWTRAVRPARLPVELRRCDITDPAEVDEAVAGVDAIVHCAKADDHETIVGGTRHVLEAAERHGIGHVVFVSTAEVYGPDVSGSVDETTPTEPTGRIYGDAKIEAEALCRSFADRGVATTILRPSLVYGPFSASWSVRMAQRLTAGNWARFEGHGDGIANLVYVDDLTATIVAALDGGAVGSEAYNVNGPDRLTWNEYFELFNAALGGEALRSVSPSASRLRTGARDAAHSVIQPVRRRFEGPLMDLYLRGGPASRVMKQVKRQLSTTPSANELTGLYARTAHYDDTKLRHHLQIRPEVDIHLGLERTVAWLQLHELMGATW